jgi:hypothetical protein
MLLSLQRGEKLGMKSAPELWSALSPLLESVLLCFIHNFISKFAAIKCLFSVLHKHNHRFKMIFGASEDQTFILKQFSGIFGF